MGCKTLQSLPHLTGRRLPDFSRINLFSVSCAILSRYIGQKEKILIAFLKNPDLNTISANSAALFPTGIWDGPVGLAVFAACLTVREL
jgi:hypothetical protein